MTHYRDWAYEGAGLLLVALLVAMVGLYFHWGLRAFGWLAVVTVFVGVWLGRAHIGVLNDIPRPPETVIGKSLLRGDDDEKRPTKEGGAS